MNLSPMFIASMRVQASAGPLKMILAPIVVLPSITGRQVWAPSIGLDSHVQVGAVAACAEIRLQVQAAGGHQEIYPRVAGSVMQPGDVGRGGWRPNGHRAIDQRAHAAGRIECVEARSRNVRRGLDQAQGLHNEACVVEVREG